MDFGLIGNPLKHSFSKEIHSYFSDYNYELCELNEASFDFFMKQRNFKGINVTIPYKQKVIPYLDYIDNSAKEINAVNTIINDNGKLKGYNTDIIGVKASFNYFGISPKGKNVLILGTGATSNTVYTAVKSEHSNQIYKAYRKTSKVKGDVLYDDISKLYDDINIIINTTSNGMYPHTDDALLTDLSRYKNLEAVMDVIYNPLRTKLLIKAENLGIKALSGLYMLIAQGYFASKLFTEKDLSLINNKHTADCDKIYQKYLKSKENIVLTGMPTCGKSTIGKKLANKLSRDFIDVDYLIEEETHEKASDFLLKYGEDKFRDVESKVIRNISTTNGTIISTGGGSILRPENIVNLKLNGKIYFINKSIALLHPTTDRPLTSNYQLLKQKYNERMPIYKKTCDKEIDGDLDTKNIIDIIISDFKL